MGWLEIPTFNKHHSVILHNPWFYDASFFNQSAHLCANVRLDRWFMVRRSLQMGSSLQPNDRTVLWKSLNVPALLLFKGIQLIMFAQFVHGIVIWLYLLPLYSTVLLFCILTYLNKNKKEERKLEVAFLRPQYIIT